MAKKKKKRERLTYAEAYAKRAADPAQQKHRQDVVKAAAKRLDKRWGPQLVLKDVLHPSWLKEIEKPEFEKPKPFDVFIPFMHFNGSLIPNSLMRYKGISDTAKLLWGRLAQYSEENGICCPAIGTLAGELGKTRDTIIKYLQELEDHGFIVIMKDPLDPDWSQHMYQFLFHPAFVREIINDPNTKKQIPKDLQEKMQKARKSKKGLGGIDSVDRGSDTTFVGFIDVTSKIQRWGGIDSIDRGGIDIINTKRTNIEEIKVIRESASLPASQVKRLDSSATSPHEHDPAVENHVAPQEIEPAGTEEPPHNEGGDNGVGLNHPKSSTDSEKKVLSLPSPTDHVTHARGERSLHYDPVLAKLYAQLDGRRR